MRYPYPEAGGISQPQRAAGQPLPFTTEKHTGSGIEPGVSDCEATVFPRRHCAPLIYERCNCHNVVSAILEILQETFFSSPVRYTSPVLSVIVQYCSPAVNTCFAKSGTLY